MGSDGQGGSAVAGGAAGALDGGSAPVPSPPAAGVPVPPVGQVTPPVGGPGHQVGDARPDLLVASGTPVRLERRATGDAAHLPFPVAPALYRLDALPYPFLVQRRGAVVPLVIAAGTVTARAHPIKGTRDGGIENISPSYLLGAFLERVSDHGQELLYVQKPD